MQCNIPLTEDQIKLINDNLVEIKERLSKTLKKNGFRLFGKSPNTLLGEAISYLPDVAKEYNPSIKKMGFHKYAPIVCIYRLLDEYRRSVKYKKCGKQHNDILESIRETLIVEKGIATQEDIDQVLTDRGLDPDDFKNIKEFKKVDFDIACSGVSVDDSSFENIDWQDLADNALEIAPKFFKEPVYTTIVKDYLIPKCSGQEYKTLNQIADQYSLTEGRISQMVRSKEMRNFLEYLYLE